jgi:hypothetical protein
MKPRLVIAMLLVFALAVPVSVLAQGSSKTEQEVRAVLDQSEQANLKGGAEAAATFDKILGDDYTRIPPNGAALTKADIVNGFKTGKIKVGSLEDSDVKIRIYGHTAVVTGVTTEKGMLSGTSVSGKARWTRIFVKRGSDWKIVLFQSTNIAELVKQAAVSATQTRNQLVGTYRLISFQRKVVATGEIEEPLGKAPQGYAVFCEGRETLIFVRDKRPKPKDLAKMTDEERAGLFKTMLALSGTYDFDGETFTFQPDVTWNEIWTGTHQKRFVKFDGRRLVLTTDPHPASADGKVSVIVVTLEKVD